METSVKKSKKRRHRRKRKSKGQESNLHSASPSRNLGVAKRIIKKRNVQKVKKVTEEHINSFIKGCCEQHISFFQSQEKDYLKHGRTKGDVFEQTVDLCDDDSSIQNSSSSLVIIPSLEVEQKNSTFIDLSKDNEQNEVIDLTEPSRMSKSYGGAAGVLEPAVIDISEDETREKSDLKPENDDIFVIGTFIKTSHLIDKCDASSSFTPLSNTWNNFNNIINCCDKLKSKYLKKKLVLGKADKNAICCKKNFQKANKTSSCSSEVTKIGKNIYVNSPVALPSRGLRPIIIDGSNVAFVHSNSNFSCRRLEICINYFKEKGHKVTAFVPQFRTNGRKSDDPELLKKLERRGDVVLTPSKKIDGRNIVPYDDRFIVQTAVLKGGIIVTRDNYNDLLKENPAWAETIKYRTLAFTWVDDVLMFPKDPLGEFGPSLEEFLRFD